MLILLSSLVFENILYPCLHQIDVACSGSGSGFDVWLFTKNNFVKFAVYNELLEICKKEKIAKATTLSIFEHVRGEISLVGWKQKTSSKKNMSMSIYDALSSKKFPEAKLDGN